jgi:hypothetical protein
MGYTIEDGHLITTQAKRKILGSFWKELMRLAIRAKGSEKAKLNTQIIKIEQQCVNLLNEEIKDATKRNEVGFITKRYEKKVKEEERKK